jgi:hypothetical protein
MTPIDSIGVSAPLFVSCVFLTIGTTVAAVSWLAAHIDRAVAPVSKQVERCTERLNAHDRILDRLTHNNDAAR